jgi:hypothetical protein
MQRWAYGLAALLALATLPACTVSLHGHQSSGGGTVATATSGSVAVATSGTNYAVGASFGQPVPLTAAGGHLVISSGSAVAALLAGIVVVNAIDYLSGGPGGRSWSSTSANRPIAHTCSCFGYRPDEEPQSPRE